MPSTPTLPTACVGGAVALSVHSAQDLLRRVCGSLPSHRCSWSEELLGPVGKGIHPTQIASKRLVGAGCACLGILAMGAMEQRVAEATLLRVPQSAASKPHQCVCVGASKQVTVLCVPYHSIAPPCETVRDELQASLHHSLCCCMPHLQVRLASGCRWNFQGVAQIGNAARGQCNPPPCQCKH